MTCVSSGGSERRAYMFRCWNRQTGESQKLLRKHVGSSPIRNTTGSIESGAYWAKRFGKSERRLTAGQTALICRYGEIRLDTSNLGFDGSNTIWVRIPVAVPGFLSFLVCYSAGTFYLILVIPGSFDTMLRSISYRKQQGFVSRVYMQRSYNG